MDGWHKTAADEAKEDARGNVVFADAVGKLRVFVEHRVEGKGY